MKITKLEWAALAVTALSLIAMIFYLIGSGSAARPVTVTAQTPRPSEPAAQVSAPSSDETDKGFPIDLNSATMEDLMRLPGIGEKRAQAILDHREKNGPFTYVEDLREVAGIGEGILADIMDYVTINGGTDDG